ncbi:MAG: methylmalonyl-CoA mutase, partial [Proteobacteria bacterium]|nr:methylmalonyl-CoA mutase [Pseudomonadota bacterium]
EAAREHAERHGGGTIFFANLGTLAQSGPRAQFARNLFASGGISAACEETEFKSRDDMVHALRKSGAQAAVICGTDAAYAEEAENAAQRLKAAGAEWVVLAGRPGESEAKLRAAGVDQFVFAGDDALIALTRLHSALGIGT